MTKQVVESGISRAVVDLTSSIRKQNRVVLGTELWRGREERERERERGKVVHNDYSLLQARVSYRQKLTDSHAYTLTHIKIWCMILITFLHTRTRETCHTVMALSLGFHYKAGTKRCYNWPLIFHLYNSLHQRSNDGGWLDQSNPVFKRKEKLRSRDHKW